MRLPPSSTAWGDCILSTWILAEVPRDLFCHSSTWAKFSRIMEVVGRYAIDLGICTLKLPGSSSLHDPKVSGKKGHPSKHQDTHCTISGSRSWWSTLQDRQELELAKSLQWCQSRRGTQQCLDVVIIHCYVMEERWAATSLLPALLLVKQVKSILNALRLLNVRVVVSLCCLLSIVTVLGPQSWGTSTDRDTKQNFFATLSTLSEVLERISSNEHLH